MRGKRGLKYWYSKISSFYLVQYDYWYASTKYGYFNFFKKRSKRISRPIWLTSIATSRRPAVMLITCVRVTWTEVTLQIKGTTEELYFDPPRLLQWGWDNHNREGRRCVYGLSGKRWSTGLHHTWTATTWTRCGESSLHKSTHSHECYV